jgi:eukaryotic-like serine/threonine-protein kinase
MTPERWAQVGGIYHDALELDAGERAAFLDRVCGGDAELRREVESLLAADAEAGGFIAGHAVSDAARMMAGGQPASLLSSSPSLITSLEGRKLGHYRVISLIGAGGMGEVYLARDLRLERKVALKVLSSEYTRDESRVRRFVQEARAVSALNHPNIITIHEVGEAEGWRYIATEFVEGQTLRQRLAAGRMKTRAALDTAIQIGHALDAAHMRGIVHRDIKPENVMVRPDGLVKVLDFGLAKLVERPPSPAKNTLDTKATTAPGLKTEPGLIMGTVAYMSPEQARGADVDARSDVFSLGVVLYEMLAGRVPFAGETMNHTLVAIMEHEPPPLSDSAPGVPAELERAVSRALSKDRTERHQTAEELLSELKAVRRQLERRDGNSPALTPDEMNEAVTVGLRHSAPHDTAQFAAARTVVGADAGTPTSSTRRFKLSRRGVIVASAVVLVAALAAAFFYFNRAPALTEKDTVLLADFVNQTGEEVFDNTLRQALAVQLEQTPFLNFLPDERVRETLRYMNRPAEERVTRELAREICQRQGVKAFVVGTVARLERRYAITLEAVNSQTGGTIASALAEADGKDETLGALGRAANELRARLGESLASIQKFAAPPEQATTSSLDALKAWSRGVELSRSGRGRDAVPFYKHAKELDPQFAKADVSLSLAYSNTGQLELAAQYAAKAYALRSRVTERERFDITSNYHALSTGDLLKAIETVELWRETYPRDYGPPSRLASLYRLVGEFEQSVAAAREANRINPRTSAPYASLGTALVQLNRFDEARAVIGQAAAEQISTVTSRRDLFYVAFVRGDAAAMREQVDALAGKPDEHWALLWQGRAASFSGRLREAEDFYRRAAALTAPQSPERAAWMAEEFALRAAACGLCEQVKSARAKPPAPQRINLQSYVPATAARALALALCGEAARAAALADEMARDNPQSTLARAVWLPVIRAAVELQRGHPAQAVELVSAANVHERAAMFWPAYLRGQARLRLKAGAEAAAEFRKILDHRGWDVTSPLYPLAQLGLARAAALAGDEAGSREARQKFLESWKDADSELPVLTAARKEAAGLNRNTTSR